MLSVLYISLYVFFLPFKVEKKDLSATTLGRHPFHIAVTEVNHNSKEMSLEISCKFFADDFEQTIEKSYKTQLDISNGKDKPLFDKFIPDYITKHLILIIDSKPVKLVYVGYEKDKESVHCFFSVSNVAVVKKIDVANKLLQDLTNDQINIMHITVNGKRQSLSLNSPASKGSFQF